MMRFSGLFLLCALSVSPVLAQTPGIAEGGVLNGASYFKGQAVAPGSLVSIFGSEFGTGITVADSIPLATSMAGVTVLFNNIPAPLHGVFGGGGGGTPQINAQVPWNVLPAGTASGTATVVVTRNGVSSPPRTVEITSAAPGIFSVEYGVGQAIAINGDGSLAAPAGSIPGISTRPAKTGDPLIILATGLGAVDPPAANGNHSLDTLRRNMATPTVLIGGVAAKVDFSGLAPQFVGVNQLNIVVPAVQPGNAVPLQIQSGGITSTDKVTIAVTN